MNEDILLVHTSGHAFSIERVMKKRGVACRITPIPRNVSSDCGVCIRFPEDKRAEVEKLTAELPFETAGILTPEEYA